MINNSSRKKILFIFGTRPEVIKLAPIINKFYKHQNLFWTKTCNTGQHTAMTNQMLDFFQIKPDYNLNLMTYDQSLTKFSSKLSERLEQILSEWLPDLIFVQGDTISALAGGLIGFYNQVKIAHIEAGLRTYNKKSPFPEEIHRVLIDHLSDLFFAPTKKCKDNLLKEGLRNNVFIVGNTIIDALFLTLKKIKKSGDKKYFRYFKKIDFSKKIILVTGHRRESFGSPLKNVCLAIKKIAKSNKDVVIVYPVHLNPNVYKPVKEILDNIENIVLLKPHDYPNLIWLLSKSFLVLTDSGGIQEEAPSLGKPILVTRSVTERMEGIIAGTAKLVGTNTAEIVKNISLLLNNRQIYDNMSRIKNPYGDGKSSQRIFKTIKNYFSDY